jgi:hypothetical protein
MTVFCDFYSADTSPATIRARGFGGVVFYASHQAGKCVTPPDAAAARAAGLEVLLVFEDAADRMLGGGSDGAADGAFARGVAEAIGYPAACPIFYAADFAATAPQIVAVEAYCRGAAGPSGHPVGIYGGLATVNSVIGTGAAAVAWQTLAWSGGQVSKHAALYQSAIGAQFDTDTQLGPITAWGGTTPPAPPTPGEAVSALVRPVCAIAIRPQNDGYWLVAQDGGIFAFGAAPVFTDPVTGKLNPGHLITAAAASPSGSGLYLGASDGGVMCFGDAQFHGSIPGDNIGPSSQPLEAAHNPGETAPGPTPT